ncbi:MAG: hypothetical protein J6Z23_02805, partial [Lachnospiraceae bacterium]|nr:hypothetical protein [Lachnospiraceae bacterium]
AYVAFVDGDDRVRPDFLRTLMDALDETGAEIAECGVVKVYPGEEAQAEEAAAGAGPTVSQSAESQAGAGPATGLADTEPTAPGTGESPGTGPSPAYTLCSTEHALRLLIGDRVLHQHVWNKLYRRDVLDGIPFPEGRTNEDEFWTYRVFARAAYVCRVDAPLYEYVQRERSIMGSPFALRRLDGLDARAERLAFVREHFPGLAREAKMNLYGSCIYSGQMSLKYLKGSERHKALKKVDAIRKTCVPTASEIAAEPFSARVWLRLSKVSFFGLCRLKNLLGKGF